MSLSIPARTFLPFTAAALLLLLATSIPTSGQEPAAPSPELSDAKVLAPLELPVTVDFDETSLADVTTFFEASAGVKVKIDHRRLEEIGIADDTPVTLSVHKMRLKSALHHILAQLYLTYTVHDGAIVITTLEGQEEALTERKYPVGDLAEVEPLAPAASEFDTLVDSIQWTIQPADWEDVGGVGTIEARDDSLVVKQTYGNHDALHHYLVALRMARQIAAKHADRAPPVTSVWAADGDGPAIRAALDKPLSLEFIETPLADVAKHVGDETGINILIDVVALEDVGIGDDTPVTLYVNRISAAAALSRMLRDLDLTWEIRDDAIVITTPEEAESKLAVRVYPVLDLVRLPAAQGLALSEEFNDYDSLIDLLTSLACPNTWDVVGGPASIGTGGYGCLAISQTRDAFDEIDAFLVAYRNALAQYRDDRAALLTKPVAVDDAKHGKLRRALKRKTEAYDFNETPLADITDYMSDLGNAPIQIDYCSLEDIGVGGDLLITARVGEEPIGETLRRILKPHGLTWTLRDEVILITTKEESEATNVVKFYPAGDLIEREDDLDVNARWGRCDMLYDILTTRLKPGSWEESGGLGVVQTPLHPVLVVAQTEEIHDQVAELLAAVRADEQRTWEVIGHDPSRRSLNAKGETLYMKNYELIDVTVQETESLAEMARDLVETKVWDSQDRYSIQASMTGSTIVVRHNASTHRKIQRLLIELELLKMEGLGYNWTGPAVTRLPSLSLSGAHTDNSLDKSLVLRVFRLDKETELTPEQLADEIRRQIKPDGWLERSGVALHQFRKQLIIRHTPSIQREISQLLSRKDVLLKPQPMWGGFF